MKTNSPVPSQVFSPEVSHTLQAWNFIEKSLGLKEPKEMQPEKTEVANPVPQPRFKIVEGPLNFGNPWKDTGTDDDSDFVQIYVTRDLQDIEAIAEVESCAGTDCKEEDHELCVQIGNCFDLRGNQLYLTLEEQDSARQDWIKCQENKRSHDAEY